MKFTVDKREKFCILTLDDDKLLSANAPQLKSELAVLNAEGYKNLILDMGIVQVVDSSGLSAILIGNRLCKDSNGTFVLAQPNDNFKKLIEISQLQPVLNIIPSLDEAEDFVMMEELEREMKEED